MSDDQYYSRVNRFSQNMVLVLQLMHFLKGRLLLFPVLTLLWLAITVIEGYELSVVNNATMGVDSTTTYLDNQLIWESSSTFYLVQINSGNYGKVLRVDQSSGNNVTDNVDLPIDNFNADLHFVSFNLQNTIGFMYNQESESGSTSVLLTLNKDNLTESTTTSLQNGYSDATYLSSYDGLLAISQYNQVNVLMNPETFDGNTIQGPFLQNNWQSITDASLTKSSSQSFSLLFSPTQQIFQLIYLQTNPDGTPSPAIVPQTETGVSAACFKGDSLLILQQGSSINFYRLPLYQLIDTKTTQFTDTSFCYYDDITDSIVFMKQTPTETTFCKFQLSTGSDSNTTSIYNYSQFFPRDDNVYLVNKQNDSAVSYTIFDYQSCHHAYAYEPSNFECSHCPGGCISCNASQFCHDCFEGNFFVDDYCCGNSQYYTNVSSKQCHNCPKGCYNCDNSSFCYLCLANNFFIDDYCCGVSQFYVKKNTTKSCSNCPKGCYNCTNSSYCFTCLPKNNFIDDYCCGVSQYYYITNATKNCGQCPSGCYNCSNSSYCYTCNANYNYIDDYCCGLSSYYTVAESTKKCIACPTGCSTCTSSSNCLTCKTNYSLVSSYCCSNTQYFIRSNGVKTCRNCPAGCGSCSNSISCNSCASGFTMGTNQLCYNSTNGVPSTFDINSTLNTSSTTEKASQMVNNGFIGFFNSFPSVRGFLSPIFSAFLWFEEIYFFQFHERDYGKSMNKMFKEIQEIEDQKWQGLNYLFTSPFLSLFSTDISAMQQSLSLKSDYSSAYFKQRLSSGEGFLANTLSFFLSVVIITILFYLILRAIFFCLYNYRWSIFFRSYAFWPYLLIVIFQGNLIQLIFLSCSDVKFSFSRSFRQKTMNCTSFLCLFIMVVFAGSIFLLLFSRYKKNTKYFTQNLYFKKIMLIYLTIQIGMRHLVNAFLHYFLKEDHLYKVQFAILLVVEIGICSNYLYFIVCDSFRYKSKVWLSLLLSFGKMVFIFFLYFRLEFLQIDALQKKTDQALEFVVLLYIILIYANVITNVLIFIRQFVREYQKHINKQSRDHMNLVRCNKIQPVNLQQKDSKPLLPQKKSSVNSYQIKRNSKTLKQQHNTIFFQTDANQDRSSQPSAADFSRFKAVRIRRNEGIH